MKKIFILLLMVLGCLAAQSQTLQEVVYLKNGSIIRGIIVEQVPNKSIKIQTADGSLFVYDMSEVEKITKEAPLMNVNKSKTSTTSYNNFNLDERVWRKKGYRGFVDISDGGDVADAGGYSFELTTSHGYQFNPHLFLGGGIGIEALTGDEIVALPLFANVRVNILKTRVTPYVDVKGGYSPLEDTGGYFSMTLGCHVSFKERFGLNAGLGYTMQAYSTYYYSYYGGYHYRDNGSHNIMFRVGLEF